MVVTALAVVIRLLLVNIEPWPEDKQYWKKFLDANYPQNPFWG
jgi:hypothetical protein